ncbi:MAG TPA: histidine kinase [Candidatus Binatia bacterium]|jgi:signal transduction histidine kinase
MSSPALEMERSVARCRVLLSLAAILAWYVDPTEPTLTRWLPLTGGTFVLNRYWVSVLLAHLAYSVVLASAYAMREPPLARLAAIATAADVLFGAAIALVTEGVTSLYYVFFAFAVLSVGLRSGLRSALIVTAFSLLFYTTLTVLSAPSGQHYYVMRAAYLGMTGYLVGYLGQHRLNQEERLRTLEASSQRERIARSLHDGYAQALAGVNLRLESCRQLLQRGRAEEVLHELAELQAGVNREHDEIRDYIHSLVEREALPLSAEPNAATRFLVSAHFAGDAALVEHVLLIMLEATRNVTRHAHARSADIRVRAVKSYLTLAVDDDGIGFHDPPWSIASRVAELGGEISIDERYDGGGHLRVQLPAI